MERPYAVFKWESSSGTERPPWEEDPPPCTPYPHLACTPYPQRATGWTFPKQAQQPATSRQPPAASVRNRHTQAVMGAQSLQRLIRSSFGNQETNDTPLRPLSSSIPLLHLIFPLGAAGRQPLLGGSYRSEGASGASAPRDLRARFSSSPLAQLTSPSGGLKVEDKAQSKGGGQRLGSPQSAAMWSDRPHFPSS